MNRTPSEFSGTTKAAVKTCSSVDSRKRSLVVLTNVEASFLRIFKLTRSQRQDKNNDQTDHFSRLLDATMRLQGACVVKIIQDETNFLESNRKSFPDDFVNQNLSTYGNWEQYFSCLGADSQRQQQTYGLSSAWTHVRSVVESFMLFVEFHRSVDRVLSTWPIPTGFSYPRTTDQLDVFLDIIPPPPSMVHSLIYRPKISAEEMRHVIAEEYRKTYDYLSGHHGSLNEKFHSLLNLDLKTELDTYRTLRDRLVSRCTKLFQPVCSKLEECQRKMTEMEEAVHALQGLDLHGERVYASQQVMGAEVLVRELNGRLQEKTCKYLVEFYSSFRKKFCRVQSSLQTHRAEATVPDEIKSVLLAMLSKWEDCLDEVIGLNSNRVLEVITNLHDVDAELEEFLESVLI